MTVTTSSTQEAINALVMLVQLSRPGEIVSVVCADKVTLAVIGGQYLRAHGVTLQTAGDRRRVYTPNGVMVDFKTEEDLKWPTHSIVVQ